MFGKFKFGKNTFLSSDPDSEEESSNESEKANNVNTKSPSISPENIAKQIDKLKQVRKLESHKDPTDKNSKSNQTKLTEENKSTSQLKQEKSNKIDSFKNEELTTEITDEFRTVSSPEESPPSKSLSSETKIIEVTFYGNTIKKYFDKVWYFAIDDIINLAQPKQSKSYVSKRKDFNQLQSEITVVKNGINFASGENILKLFPQVDGNFPGPLSRWLQQAE